MNQCMALFPIKWNIHSEQFLWSLAVALPRIMYKHNCICFYVYKHINFFCRYDQVSDRNNVKAESFVLALGSGHLLKNMKGRKGW